MVTGAAGGLGLEIAKLLAARGYAVCVADVNERGVREAAETIAGEAWGKTLDVTDPDACLALAREAAAGLELLAVSYGAAIEQGYLWHEFGDSHLILP